MNGNTQSATEGLPQPVNSFRPEVKQLACTTLHTEPHQRRPKRTPSHCTVGWLPSEHGPRVDLDRGIVI